MCVCGGGGGGGGGAPICQSVFSSVNRTRPGHVMGP